METVFDKLKLTAFVMLSLSKHKQNSALKLDVLS